MEGALKDAGGLLLPVGERRLPPPASVPVSLSIPEAEHRREFCTSGTEAAGAGRRDGNTHTVDPHIRLATAGPRPPRRTRRGTGEGRVFSGRRSSAASKA